MNYGKSGAPKPARGAPKFDPHRTPGQAKDDAAKAALVARMKAAAEKKKDG
ncbi:hypothetical protein [Marivita sp.]|uniref:hypothetical protein n=1 Tax=Marivita sp. TaxID=2003365 RepID=UPI0025C46BF3|nr:hypothetical protein [Marivita sp.]